MASGNSFCPVCAEQLVRRLFRFVDPVDRIEQDEVAERFVALLERLSERTGPAATGGGEG